MTNLRKSSVLWELKNVKFMETEPLDFSKAQQLPSFKHLIKRYLTLIRDRGSNMKTAIHYLAKEFEYNWIFMNVYPISVKAIKEKFTRFLSDVDKMKRCAVTKRGPTWNEKADDLISILDNGVDIKCHDPTLVEYMEAVFGVKEGEDEVLLYNDNCKTVHTDGDVELKHNPKYKDWLLG